MTSVFLRKVGLCGALGALPLLVLQMPPAAHALAVAPGWEADSFRALPQLPGTAPLDLPEHVATLQHRQIEEYFLRRIAATTGERDRLWRLEELGPAELTAFLQARRKNLRSLLGLSPDSERYQAAGRTLLLDGEVRVEEVGLTLEPGFSTRALLFSPRRYANGAAVVAVPSARETQEAFAGLEGSGGGSPWLHALLRRGVTVAVAVTVERSEDHPLAELSRGARMNRRQLLHRLAFVVGRTLVGLEVEQVLALRRYLAHEGGIDPERIGLLGERQGAMTALYAAAVEERFSAVTVFDYFDRREALWQEPVDRMLYGQLLEFGDAEVAGLVAPRPLTLAYPPAGPVETSGRRLEQQRAGAFFRKLGATDSLAILDEVGPEAAAAAMAERLSAGILRDASTIDLAVPQQNIHRARDLHFQGLHQYLRRLTEESDAKRSHYWNLHDASPEDRPARTQALRRELENLMGSIPEQHRVAPHPRSALIEEREDFAAYDVVLDVVEGVEAWGHLLVPRRLQGRAPAVIAQHGGGGVPSDLTGVRVTRSSVYYEYGRRLAEDGYVVFAPFVAVGNLPLPDAEDREEYLRRVMEEALNPKVRQAAAVGMMRTRIELEKLRTVVDFLQSLPFVDGERIGYYGLSYGGYAATWMPPLEPRLKAVVISGHFNDWRPKITSERIATSYLRHPDEDFSNWNVLHRFTHLELIAAMWPAAVLIEYGERDAVTPPGWYRKAWREVARLAAAWGMEEKIGEDYFAGGHEIHGVGSFDFLNRWLRPERAAAREYHNPDRGEISHFLDSKTGSRVAGYFYVSSENPVFSGIQVKLGRRGEPGDLIVRFGSVERGEDLGVVRVRAEEVEGEEGVWHPLRVTPVRLAPGSTYSFEVTADWGWKESGHHWILYGPKPLGGEAFPPNFGLFFRTLGGD